jgi:hypothetical protein
VFDVMPSRTIERPFFGDSKFAARTFAEIDPRIGTAAINHRSTERRAMVITHRGRNAPNHAL